MDLGIAEQVTRKRRAIALAYAAAALVAVLAATIHPSGYTGGGWDDEHYLAAARCWVAHSGPCVPNSHWWTRWPLIAPMAACLGLLGESRFAAQLAPGLWWAIALIMTAWVGNALFGWRAGAVALALLGSSAIIASRAFAPNVDIPELALQLSALAAAMAAYRRQSALVAFAAGILAGMAVQARDTSLVFVGASAVMWLTLPRDKRNVLLWALAGFATAELAEMLVYGVGTGDPFMRMRLAMGHTKFPTDQLVDGFHSDRGPLLNPDYMRSWKREMDVNIWWPIDPWLNLFASPHTGPLIISSAIATALFTKSLGVADKRKIARLLGGAALIAIGLVYVLAIDPKARMFMAGYAALALVGGAAIAKGFENRKALAATLAILPLAFGLYVMCLSATPTSGEARARQWIARYGQDIEIFSGAASYLTFVPETRALAPKGSGRRYVILTSKFACEQLIDKRPGHRNGILIDQISEYGHLCLFEYLPIRPSVVR